MIAATIPPAAELPASRLDDADMQAAPAALARAAQRARETAARTGTGLIVCRDGKLVEEVISTSPSGQA